MSSIVISGDSSGAITLAAPSVAGTNTATLPAAAGTVMVSGNMPAFSAYGSALTSVNNATNTKISFNTVIFDTNSNFSTANSRFTPTVAGYYQFNLCLLGAAVGGSSQGLFFKNGSQYSNGVQFTNNSSAGTVLNATCLMYMNGTTDYAEVYMWQNSGGTVTCGSNSTSYAFSGVLVRAA